ncbi:MAG: hypothetical protein IJW77_14205 [Clostridia bacterium]|nr:hypothetical protein [Clostridia bacterium]
MRRFPNQTQIAAALTAALMLASLSACGGSTDLVETQAQTADTASETEAVTLTEQQMYINNLPEADYGGDVFRILSLPDNISWGRVSYSAEEEVGEILNDFIYSRNRAVEERYNTTIEEERSENIPSMVRNMVSAGLCDYHLISDYVKSIMTVAVNGYYINLHNVDSLNFDNPWWDKECTELLTMEDRLFVAFNDMNTQPLTQLACLLFNNGLISAFDLESPYQAVLDGRWTMDLFNSMSRAVSADVNGDGAMDEHDRFGFITGVGAFSPWMTGGGQPLVLIDKDGVPKINYGSEAAIAVAEKIDIAVNDKTTAVYLNDVSWGGSVFMNGRGLFRMDTMGSLESYRDSEMDIGALPIPKFDETQENYRTMMGNCSMGVSLPNTALDTDFAGNIIEALGAYSYIDLKNAYYEVTLKDKASRDEYTPMMLDIIVSSRTVDVSVINEFSWGNVVSSFLSSIRRNGAEQLASLQEKNESKFEKTYEKIRDQYAALD